MMADVLRFLIRIIISNMHSYINPVLNYYSNSFDINTLLQVFHEYADTLYWSYTYVLLHSSNHKNYILFLRTKLSEQSRLGYVMRRRLTLIHDHRRWEGSLSSRKGKTILLSTAAEKPIAARTIAAQRWRCRLGGGDRGGSGGRQV